MTSTTLDDLLAAVIREPDCDVIRHVFADALEEAGQTARAEFVRLQLELAKVRLVVLRHVHESAWWSESCAECKRYDELSRLEAILIPQQYAPHPVMHCEGWSYRRGFVESVTCSVGEWMEHGPAIVRATPLRVVTISDREPRRDGPDVVWYAEHVQPRGEPSNLPQCIFVMLNDGKYTQQMAIDYRRRGDAMYHLSRAAIAWAKAQPLAIVDADGV